MITEKELQNQIIELIKNESFHESINNQESSIEALNVNSDEDHIPHLSIDDLLKKKYSKSCIHVLESIIDCEIITGDMIKDISLSSEEKLFPDIILFNRESAQIILIENKVSSKTGREAITEVFGYMNEIRNHLPFTSHYDVSIIIISPTFDTLLDHSISSNILSSNINLLCLLPNFESEQLTFDIHYPKSWTHIGQNNLPKNGLVSYSWGLAKKDEGVDFNELAVINLAKELIVNNANRYNSSGFLLIWESSLVYQSLSKFVITIYVVNPFSFLPNADLYGFQYRSSVLSNYLKEYNNDYNGLVHTSSLFKIMDDAVIFLEEYYNIEIDTASEWTRDFTDEKFRLERKPILFDSWGLIGDYVRYFYFHPAVRKHYFEKTDDNFLGHLNPIIGLQIINIITKNTIFNDGHFRGYDLFKFGKQLANFNYACKNALHAKNETLNNALLFWSVLEISQSLKEILFYASNTIGIKENITLHIHLPLDSKRVKTGYREQNDKFSENFQELFLSGDVNKKYRAIFQFGYSYGMYFNDSLVDTISKKDQITIEKEIAEFVKKYLISIALSVKDKNRKLNKTEILFFNTYFTIEGFFETSIVEISKVIEHSSDKFLTSIFTEFLESFTVTIGIPYRELQEIFIPKSVDWKWMKYSLTEKFKQGLKRGVVNIEPNGSITISQIDEDFNFLPEIENENEIYLKTYTSTVGAIIRKVLWDDIESGKAFPS
ncbi:hypothetical protein [Flavobacterium sp. 1355]|uniref:hypothetical protein n=1 Tax=Flavobacterium sp. 1355 TaxID=2806571 RepID=UPI001AE9FCB8|nr:hypothetical protein [Flavobacterium sp. 1355]MBP1222356.1 hypothetical protein [Flavobacterium sp. 1355]